MSERRYELVEVGITENKNCPFWSFDNKEEISCCNIDKEICSYLDCDKGSTEQEWVKKIAKSIHKDFDEFHDGMKEAALRQAQKVIEDLKRN